MSAQWKGATPYVSIQPKCHVNKCLHVFLRARTRQLLSVLFGYLRKQRKTYQIVLFTEREPSALWPSLTFLSMPHRWAIHKTENIKKKNVRETFLQVSFWQPFYLDNGAVIVHSAAHSQTARTRQKATQQECTCWIDVDTAAYIRTVMQKWVQSLITSLLKTVSKAVFEFLPWPPSVQHPIKCMLGFFFFYLLVVSILLI